MLEREALPCKIDVFFEFLSRDDGPHSIKENSMTLNTPLDEWESIASFRVEYDDYAESEDKGINIDCKTRDFVLTTIDKPILQGTPTH